MGREWRCHQCNKLLGIVEHGQVHLRFSRGHEYIAGLPAVGVCRGCRTLNRTAESGSEPTSARASR